MNFGTAYLSCVALLFSYFIDSCFLAHLIRPTLCSRHYAEHSGYFEKTSFVQEVGKIAEGETINFYDSNNGKLLFVAPQGRSMDAFLKESRAHGWPSFRDDEVNWENVRCLKDGETVSVDGAHLGHNLPDGKGSRYCINLVSVAGKPDGESS